MTITVTLLGGACGRTRRTEGVRRFTISGTVVERDETHSRLTIAHEAVTGLMPAMTMPFRVANLNPAVQPGDKVIGTLLVMPDDGWIEGLTVTRKRDASFLPPAPAATRAGAGTEVPDFRLRNQDGAEIGIRGFRGQFLVLTFIYTRCPFPDYCPLMMKNFNGLKRTLAQHPELKGRVHLMSVTIDPAYDTPSVLRAYGERTIAGGEPFTHWDLATGSPDQVRRMATWFGLTYYEESGQITHSLATAVIDPRGALIEILGGNSWRPEDVLKLLATA